MTIKHKIEPYIVDIISELQAAGYAAYIVGGAVRDLLLERRPKDYDLSTSATPEEIKRVFRKRRVMIIGRRFRLVHLYHGDEIIEISTFRRKPERSQKEVKPAKMASAPEHMIFRDNEFGSEEEDAERRDFTVNALFYDPVNDRIIDHTELGMNDIKKGIVRAIGNPAVRFEEDPVRILRALKLAGQYGFQLDPGTDRALRNSLNLIKLAAPSRMTLELEKILKNPYGDQIFDVFYKYGLLKYVLPGISEKWESGELAPMRNMWRVRNERVRSGEYRESISLAITLLAWPLVRTMIRNVDPADKSAATEPVQYLVEEAIAHIFNPRTPTRRAIEAAARTIVFQPKFLDESEDNIARFQQQRGYAHAREFALIRGLCAGEYDRFVKIWPKGNPSRGGNRAPFRRSFSKPRKRPGSST